MTPDTRPDVTALVNRLHGACSYRRAATMADIETTRPCCREFDDPDDWCLGCQAARRLTEQNAEIARLREELADALEANRIFRLGINLYGEKLTAAEQARAAALRERDEAQELLRRYDIQSDLPEWDGAMREAWEHEVMAMFWGRHPSVPEPTSHTSADNAVVQLPKNDTESRQS